MKSNIFIFALLLSLVSCSDFLEPDSLSTFDSKYVFSNVDDARKGVNAAYVQFGTDGFRSRLSNNMAGNTDIERQSGWTSSSDRYQIWNLDALSTNGDLRQFWNSAYTSIRDANIAIEGIESSGSLESNDAQTKRLMYNMLGEVYTLRAYWYSMLIYFFGDVPNVRLAPKAGVDFYLPRENRNVILTQLIDDLKAIEDKMLWADQCQYGTEQVNREFTLGMIARLALQRGGYYLKPDMTMAREGDYKTYYQIAKDYTAKLISLKDRELPTDYRQVFLNQNKFVTTVNSEMLFEVPFALGNGDVGWNIGITVQGGATATHAFGSGNNYMAVPQSYYFSFDTTDIRRDVTCALYQVNTKFQEEFTNANNIAQGKWSRYFLNAPQGQNSAKGTGINWPMMRYADVLLMYAEAENELNGPTAEAKSAFKRVRQRAFSSSAWAEKVDAYTDSRSGSKEEFFNAIVDERGWEFGGEMIRKYELIRWGIYSKKMQEIVNIQKQMVDDALAGTGKYANLPDYMYWKRNDAGKFIVLNPNTRVAGVPDPSWTRVPFVRAMYDNTKMTYSDFVIKDWEPYYNGPVPGVARYIFPVPLEAVSASQGKVDNNGYMFK